VLRIGAAQMGPIHKADSRQAVVRRMLDLLEQAKSETRDFVVYPELALTTFFPRWDLADAELFADVESAESAWPDLERALAQLPPDQREAVVLRYADDLTYEEMARVTGAGESALKMQVQRAFARLRALLQEVSDV
jgi:RNA polymerase sigma factor (sigma-70 family)